MKAFAVVLIVLSLVGCRHKKAKDASDEDKEESSAKASASESGKCDVKGFAYSMPKPGPITDGGAQ